MTTFAANRLGLALRARPRMMLSLLTGGATALLVPGTLSLVTRALLGWSVAVWLYLLLVGAMMLRAYHGRIRRIAQAQAESAPAVLTIGVLAALISLADIVVQLAAAKLPGAPHGWPQLLFALSTVAASWLLTSTLFTLTYVSVFYATLGPRSLRFAEGDDTFAPHYGDFHYFFDTIAVGVADCRRQRGLATHAAAGAGALTGVLCVQHRHPGLHDQRGRQHVLKHSGLEHNAG